MSRHPSYDPKKHSITLLEATKIAGSSSGKGGGLLAAWAEPECLAPLSFALHAKLAQDHDGTSNWGYRRVHCADCEAVGHSVSDQEREPNEQVNRVSHWPKELDWILPNCIKSYDEVGNPINTGQVHPYLFTTSIARLAEARGVKIVLGSVTSIESTAKDGVTHVIFVNKCESALQSIRATDVVVAAGSWTSSVFPPATIGGAENHSIVIQPSRPLSANMLFLSVSQGSAGGSKFITPEAYPRPDGTLYACEAANPNVPLPLQSDQVQIVDQSCMDIWNAVASISKELRQGVLLTKQACYQPVILHNGERKKNVGPIVGSTNIKGIILASGHDSWGIQNAPGTGKVISEMIFDGTAVSADVKSLGLEEVMRRASFDPGVQ